MRQPAFTAFPKAVLGDSKEVSFVLEGKKPFQVCDGENVLKNTFQAYFETLLRRNVILEEVIV